MNDRLRDMLMKFPVAVATVNADGTPHIAVVAYVKVLDGGGLVITCNYLKRTVGNIKANPRVALVVWDNDWHGVRIFGEAAYHEDGKYVEMVKQMPENSDEPADGALVVAVEKIEEIG